MIRIVLGVFSIVMLLQSSVVFAQESINDIENSIDSLRVTRSDLTRQLRSVDQEISRLELRLQEYATKELAGVKGVVITNMDASMRDEPRPGATVIRTIPQNTVVEALDYNGEYWMVRHENAQGWVMRVFVNEGEGAERIKEEAESKGLMKAEISHASLSWEKEREGKTFLITDLAIHTNTAGGISIQYAIEHLDSTRTIREVVFSTTPYNSEGSIERGKNSGVSTRRLRRFGPVSVYDGTQRLQFDNVWYNSNIECVELNRVDIAYSDGTRTSFSKDINNILTSNIINSCQITAADSLKPETSPVPE